MAGVTGAEGHAHPYERAWRTRDVDELLSAMSPAIVLESPLLRSNFVGLDAARDLFASLFDAVDDFEITTRLVDGETSAFFWTARAGGKRVDGVDLIRVDRAGSIERIVVYVRPLLGLARFAAILGPALGRRNGPLSGALNRAASAPLVPMFGALDWLATKLAGVADGRRSGRDRC